MRYCTISRAQQTIYLKDKTKESTNKRKYASSYSENKNTAIIFVNIMAVKWVRYDQSHIAPTHLFLEIKTII
jgi:hypothetical protein